MQYLFHLIAFMSFPARTLDVLHVRSTYKFDSVYISVNVFHFVNMDQIC